MTRWDQKVEGELQNFLCKKTNRVFCLSLTNCGDICVVILFITVSVDNAGLANIGIAQNQNLIGRHKIQSHCFTGQKKFFF